MNQKSPTQALIKAVDEQFGAALAMMKEDLAKCSDQLWYDTSRGPAFWQIVYHTLHYFDLYLCNTAKERELFRPKFEHVPYRLDQSPDLTLTKEQVQKYFDMCHEKAKKYFHTMKLDDLLNPPLFDWHGINVLSSLLYNLRHVMLHVGTLNYRILRAGIKLDNWVSEQNIAF